MNAKVFSGSMILGLGLLTAGIWLHYSPAEALMVLGGGIVLLTIIMAMIGGRR